MTKLTDSWPDGQGVLRALLVVAACTLAVELARPWVDLTSIAMLYLAGVVYIALKEPPAASVGVVITSLVLINFLYVPPRWGFKPLDARHFVTYAVMLGVGLLISRVGARVRSEAQSAADAKLDAEAERMRNTVLAGASHDFRTPLTTIIGAASSLEQQGPLLDDAMRQTLSASIVREARRLHAMLSEVLEFTRLEEGATPLRAEWCPADELVREAVSAAGGGQAHPLEVRVQPDAIVWCDPMLVQRVLVNLLENAYAHTPARTKVRVSLEARPSEWSVVVSDDGPGLPPGRERDLLRKYETSGRSPSPSGRMGLGLAICAAIARLHGGVLEASGGPGARMMLTLPQPAAQAPAVAMELD